MKLPRTILAASLAIAALANSNAQEVLTGDASLACQAILCLATGSPPNECMPALSRFYSINYQYWSDTLQGRINFLNQCPVANMTPSMRSLTNAMANGAGRCDAASLNSTLLFWVQGPGHNSPGQTYIGNSTPDYCTAYTSHPYTDLSTLKPVYIGIPSRGGHWVSPANYSQELAAYNARIAAEDLAMSMDSSN